jgi:hypothetical protein
MTKELRQLGQRLEQLWRPAGVTVPQLAVAQG